MKILINGTALDKRGAYSVLKSFILDMVKYRNFLENEKIKLHLLVSRKELCEYEGSNIRIEYDPNTKKSIYYKWEFENNIIPEIIKRGKFDAYLSLQNYIFTKINVKQFVLIHQPIPFSNLKINELEFKNFLKYKILMKLLFKKQRKYTDGVIVQTQWMKDAVINKYGYNCPVVIIRPPVTNIYKNNKVLDPFLKNELSLEGLKLFYPTNTEKYKNNEKVIKAVEEYNKRNHKKVMLYITIEGDSNDYIRYIGKVPYESIFNFYNNVNALIFPSLTETMGFPLLEAKQCGLPILASDLSFSREICGDSAYYFQPRDIHSMIDTIIKFSDNNIKIIRKENIEMTSDSYLDYIKFICSN